MAESDNSKSNRALLLAAELSVALVMKSEASGFPRLIIDCCHNLTGSFLGIEQQAPSAPESTPETVVILEPQYATVIASQVVIPLVQTLQRKICQFTDPNFAAVVFEIESIVIESPAFAPIWKTAPENPPSNNFVPLKVVCCATRSISETKADTSF